MKAFVIVMPKPALLDPQGEAVRKAIAHLGMDCVEQARIGKFIELDIAGANLALTRDRLETICRDLLSNPVIEDYQLELIPDGTPKRPIDIPPVPLKRAQSAPPLKTPPKTPAKPAPKSRAKSKPAPKSRKKRR